MKTKSSLHDTSRLFLLPIALVLAFVPLVVRVYPYQTGLEKYPYYSTDGYATDIFLHGKMVLFLGLCAVMALLCFAKIFMTLPRNKQAARTKSAALLPKVFIPLFAYAGLAVLSSLISEYQPYPRTGIYSQFESCFVLLGYVLCAYYTYLSVNKEDDIKIVLAALGFSAAVMVIIGFSQAFFTDFFRTEAGIRLMIPGRYYQQFKESGSEVYPRFKIWKVFMTLSNPNYVGSYVPLILPVALAAMFAVQKLWLKIAAGVLCAGLLVCLFGSGSRTGFIALLIALAVLLFLLAKNARRILIPAAAAGAVFVLIFIIYAVNSGTGYFERIRDVLSFNTRENAVEGIITTDHDVQLIYKGNTLHVEYELDEGVRISCMDDDGNWLDLTPNETMEYVTVDDPRFSGITIAPAQLTDEVDGFEIFAERSWYFTKFSDGYYYYTPYGKFIRHDISKAWKWLDSHGMFATGRGYTWARTIPLLKQYILLGSGADTFQLVYPNDDFVASYNSTNWGFIITKPHCMYLQIAVQTGVLSLICVLAYLCFFAVICIKAIRGTKQTAAGQPTASAAKNDNNFTSKPAQKTSLSFGRLICAGITAGTFGYLAAQIFNDSTVGIAPLFWTLTGIGLAAAGIEDGAAVKNR